MVSKGKTFALLLAILFLTSMVIAPIKNVKASVNSKTSYFPLTEYNATVILLKGASYAESQYYPAHNGSLGYYPSTWYFAMLSTFNANGYDDIFVSAQNCNITITNISSTMQNTEGYYYNSSSWLNYTVSGRGSQFISYIQLSNNTSIYIDNTAKKQGDGWNWYIDGIAVNGAISTVSIFSTRTEYLPPRDAPHLSYYYVIGFIAIVIFVISLITAVLVLFRRHRKTINSK